MSILKRIKTYWRKRFFAWIKKRRPASSYLKLDQKNTYIFPTRYGFILVFIVLLMGIGATNYQNNMVFIATFSVISLGIMGILLTYANLTGLSMRSHVPEPVFAGESARFHISVNSDKDHFAIAFGLHGDVHQTVNISSDEESRIELLQLCQNRGRHSMAPLKCQTFFPFGFMQAWSWAFFEVNCLVYPAPIAPSENSLEAGDQSQQYSNEFKPGHEDFYGLKVYQQGDPLSRVHWKSFAKEKGMQTKAFVDYVSEPEMFRFDDFTGADTELRLSYLCHLCLDAFNQNKRFGLTLPGIEIEVDEGESHCHRCLEALAEFEGANKCT